MEARYCHFENLFLTILGSKKTQARQSLLPIKMAQPPAVVAFLKQRSTSCTPDQCSARKSTVVPPPEEYGYPRPFDIRVKPYRFLADCAARRAEGPCDIIYWPVVPTDV